MVKFNLEDEGDMRLHEASEKGDEKTVPTTYNTKSTHDAVEEQRSPSRGHSSSVGPLSLAFCICSLSTTCVKEGAVTGIDSIGGRGRYSLSPVNSET